MTRRRGSGAAISWDDSELDRLAVDLSGAPLRIQFGAPKALRKSARVVEREMRVDATGHKGNFFGIPGTEFVTPVEQHVSSELLSDYEAEIGIEAKGAGKLAHIIAYGSANNGPAYDPGAGTRRAMPTVLDILADLNEESVLGKGRA